MAILSAVTMALAFSSAAVAEPSQEELRDKIDKAGKSLSVVVEKYNEAREKLKNTKRKAAALNEELRPMQERVDALHAEAGKIAAAVYRGGQANVVDAMLTSGSPSTLIDQMATLDVLANKQHEQIQRLNAAKAELDAKKDVIDKLLQERAELAKKLAADKRKLQSQVDKHEKMYEKAYGPLNPPQQSFGEPPYVGGKAQAVVDYAYAQLGKPYEFGADGPDSYDCSGLVMASYQQIGVSLPHSARGQYGATQRVDRANIKPGDILFFYSDLHHNGIYIGGNTMIHAPQPGEYVEKININYMPYAGAGRPRY